MSPAQHQGPIMHRVRNVVNDCILYEYGNGACVIQPGVVSLTVCFRRINHMAVKDHFHSSSDVQRVALGTNNADRRVKLKHGSRLGIHMCVQDNHPTYRF
jgi:hypothetical protein